MQWRRTALTAWPAQGWSWLLRGLALFGAWLVLTGAGGGLLVGAALSALIAAASLGWIAPGPRWRLQHLPALLLYLLRASVVSGVDVALRALGLRPQVDPVMVEVPLHADHGLRVLVAYGATILPGTVAADLTPDGLVLHVLDRHADVHSLIDDLARRIQRVFGGEMEGARP